MCLKLPSHLVTRKTFCLLCLLTCMMTGCRPSVESLTGAPEPSQNVTLKSEEEILKQLQNAAREKSISETEISITTSAKESDGTFVVTAQKNSPNSICNYTIYFRYQDDQWVCFKADSHEIESSGGKTTNNLNANGMKLEQILIWLDW